MEIIFFIVLMKNTWMFFVLGHCFEYTNIRNFYGFDEKCWNVFWDSTKRTTRDISYAVKALSELCFEARFNIFDNSFLDLCCFSVITNAGLPWIKLSISTTVVLSLWQLHAWCKKKSKLNNIIKANIIGNFIRWKTRRGSDARMLVVDRALLGIIALLRYIENYSNG